MYTRNIVVVMPFGGKERPVDRRRAILNFKRLEYLVLHKCHVNSAADPSAKVTYTIEVCKTAIDEIPDKVLQQIYQADILIALIAEHNPNVIYEVAYRRYLERKFILVVASPEELPLYLQGYAHSDWKQASILERIDKIAMDKFPVLGDFKADIPEALREQIDDDDHKLQAELQDALNAIERQFVQEPSVAAQHLIGIVSGETSSFYPCSIVNVSFAENGVFAKNPAIVSAFDDKFARLYGYTDKNAAHDDRPLTLEKLSNRMKKYIDGGEWDKFVEEQIRLTATVIQGYGFAIATIPLQINKNHPHREYRGASYLPCLIAQVIDGDRNAGPHQMYLLVVYIEIPNTFNPGGPLP